MSFWYATSLTPCKLMNVLESVEVDKEKSVITDSLMYRIKRSSAPDQDTPTVLLQSIATPNRHFCQFIIDYLAMVLYFDCWYPFLSNSTPAPFRKVSTLSSNRIYFIYYCIYSSFFHRWSRVCLMQSLRGYLTIVRSYSRFVWGSTPSLPGNWCRIREGSYRGRLLRCIRCSPQSPIIGTRWPKELFHLSKIMIRRVKLPTIYGCHSFCSLSNFPFICCDREIIINVFGSITGLSSNLCIPILGHVMDMLISLIRIFL